MMKQKYILYCILFIATTGKVDAQADALHATSLKECRELALAHNKSLAIADRNKEKSGYTQKAYWANYFPKLSATGNYLYTDTEMNRSLFPGMDIALEPSGTWMAGLQAKQPIYTGGKITSGYNMAKIGNEIAGLNQNSTRVDIIVQTDEAYWAYVQTNEQLKLALAYHKVVSELLRNVQDAQEVGLKHTNDVLKVQVKVNEAELQILQVKNGVNLSRKNLCHIMGMPLNTVVTLPESFDDLPPIFPDKNAGYANRPEFAILEQQVKLKEQEIKLTRSDFLPQIGVMANYSYTNGVKLNGDKLLDKASFSVMASVSIPLFQWGEGRNKVRAAKAERDIMQLQRDDMGEMMELELAMALDKCEESALEVALTINSLQQAEENMKVCADKYKEGMETLADYLEAQTAWQRAFMEYINAKTRQRLNQTYYMKAIGVLQ